MPLAAFIEGAMTQLANGDYEILVGDAAYMRANPGVGEHAWVTKFNETMSLGAPLG